MSRLGIESPPGTASGAGQRPESADSIGAWLDRLLRLARLPSGESAEIRDELDAHLRERVRDLMLAGHDEAEAIHKSISELGDLALLAHRYRDASRTPKGRTIMHFSLIAAVGTALGLSALAYQQSQPGQPSTPPAARADDAAGTSAELSLEVRPEASGNIRVVPILRDLPIVSRFYSNDDASGVTIEAAMQGPEELGALVHFLAESQGLRAYIHWRDLDGVAAPDESVDELPLQGQSPERAFGMINDSLGLEGAQRIAYRSEGGLLEVATQRFFDRRDRELVTYDVSGLLNADEPLEVTNESGVLVELITEIIEPDSWVHNGGDVGAIFAAGDKLFVSGPPRLQERVAWLLTKLMDDAGEHADAGALPGLEIAQITAAEAAVTSDIEMAPMLEMLGAGSPEVITPGLTKLPDAAVVSVSLEVYPLGSTTASELAPILRGALAPLGGTVAADARTNALIIQGGEEIQEKAAAIIHALDRDPNAGREVAPAGVERTSLRAPGNN
ncbi:MAG: hypothetical protein IPJ41_05070 [Phycisphaerales bacterium]|nr:hypothetical protein [Phycisphaerales bacterium]